MDSIVVIIILIFLNVFYIGGSLSTENIKLIRVSLTAKTSIDIHTCLASNLHISMHIKINIFISTAEHLTFVRTAAEGLVLKN